MATVTRAPAGRTQALRWLMHRAGRRRRPPRTELTDLLLDLRLYADLVQRIDPHVGELHEVLRRQEDVGRVQCVVGLLVEQTIHASASAGPDRLTLTQA